MAKNFKNMKTIDELLEEVGEDKFQNLATTSFKFKTDVWEFFKAIEGVDKWNCCEFGTHKGQSSRILSFLFFKMTLLFLLLKNFTNLL